MSYIILKHYKLFESCYLVTLGTQIAFVKYNMIISVIGLIKAFDSLKVSRVTRAEELLFVVIIIGVSQMIISIEFAREEDLDSLISLVKNIISGTIN